jgi:hypothetical protein
MGSTVVAAVQLFLFIYCVCFSKKRAWTCHQYVHDVICEMLCELFRGTCLFVYHLLDLPMTMKILQQIVPLSHVPFPALDSHDKSLVSNALPQMYILFPQFWCGSNEDRHIHHLPIHLLGPYLLDKFTFAHTRPGFLLRILWCSQNGNHPENNLAKFCYKRFC